MATTSGVDLTGWETAVGDAVYVAPTDPLYPEPIGLDDITVEHYATHSLLRANIRNRGAMAHVISFKRITDLAMMTAAHQAKFQFRMPYIPKPQGGQTYNAQSLEGGFFVWDGAGTRLDYGTAFQWMLNPWLATFGDFRRWNGTTWEATGVRIPVDTAWHDAAFTLDVPTQEVNLTIDGMSLGAYFTETTKDSWGTDTSARFQAECVSLYPSSTATTAPQHQVEFRNWEWSASTAGPAEIGGLGRNPDAEITIGREPFTEVRRVG
jgi:hypothetical protein